MKSVTSASASSAPAHTSSAQPLSISSDESEPAACWPSRCESVSSGSERAAAAPSSPGSSKTSESDSECSTGCTRYSRGISSSPNGRGASSNDGVETPCRRGTGEKLSSTQRCSMLSGWLPTTASAIPGAE